MIDIDDYIIFDKVGSDNNVVKHANDIECLAKTATS